MPNAFRSLALAVCLGLLAAPAAAADLSAKSDSATELRAAARAGGAPVIVELVASGLDATSGSGGTKGAAREKAVAAAVDGFVDRFFAGRNDRDATKRRALKKMRFAPLVAFVATSAELERLASDPAVAAVYADERHAANLTESIPLIGMPEVWAEGGRGTGTAVAVLDTGVQYNHPFLRNRVIDQACFSSGALLAPDGVSFCPNGEAEQFGEPAGRDCPASFDGCEHGTHVAGIVAGFNPNPGGKPPAGAALQARVIAVQVFSGFTSTMGASTFTRDYLGALEHLYAVRDDLTGGVKLAAINMSLGGSQVFANPCRRSPVRAIIGLLREAGVATVIANGNGFHVNGIGSPACTPGAVSVGSTTKNDFVSPFSDVATYMDVFAPGSDILSSVPGGYYETLSGTSMAAPTVAGAFAALRSAVPEAGVDDILDALVATGKPITDRRLGGFVTKPRIQVDKALRALKARNANLLVSPRTPIVVPPGVDAAATFAVRLSTRSGRERWMLAGAPDWVLPALKRGVATPAGQRVRFTASPLPDKTTERIGWLVFASSDGRAPARIVQVAQRRNAPLIVANTKGLTPLAVTVRGGSASPSRFGLDVWTTKGDLVFNLVDMPEWIVADETTGVVREKRRTVSFRIVPPRRLYQPLRGVVRVVQADNGYLAAMLIVALTPQTNGRAEVSLEAVAAQ